MWEIFLIIDFCKIALNINNNSLLTAQYILWRCSLLLQIVQYLKRFQCFFTLLFSITDFCSITFLLCVSVVYPEMHTINENLHAISFYFAYIPRKCNLYVHTSSFGWKLILKMRELNKKGSQERNRREKESMHFYGTSTWNYCIKIPLKGAKDTI